MLDVLVPLDVFVDPLWVVVVVPVDVLVDPLFETEEFESVVLVPV